jgi:hypothetical protein
MKQSHGLRGLVVLFRLAAVATAALAGCGGGSTHAGPAVVTHDASTNGGAGADGSTGDDAGLPGDDASSGNPVLTAPSPDGGGPLEAHVQVNGNHGVCGACDVVLAQVQGGKQPYAYSWSDPSWQGPGPFQLCPGSATSVSLTVTDSSASSGELAMTAMTAKATTAVDCAPADGASGPGALNGCISMGGSGTPEAGSNDAGQTECTQNEVEAGIAWADGGVAASVADKLGVTFLAGHTYQVSFDRLLPIVLGPPVTVKIYGSTEPDICHADQLLFTLNLDGSIFNWHQAYCFTADRDYHYTVTNVYVQGVLVFFDVLSVSTICDSCTM